MHFHPFPHQVFSLLLVGLLSMRLLRPDARLAVARASACLEEVAILLSSHAGGLSDAAAEREQQILALLSSIHTHIIGPSTFEKSTLVADRARLISLMRQCDGDTTIPRLSKLLARASSLVWPGGQENQSCGGRINLAVDVVFFLHIGTLPIFTSLCISNLYVAVTASFVVSGAVSIVREVNDPFPSRRVV